jgi:hypothetical protein
MVVSKRHECSEVLTMGGARMAEEVGELELGDGLPKGSFSSTSTM